ncbi:MAG: hypothetical protein IJ319_05930 [Bacteroidaceae bacterium]|nr:hypothetical protein [Bacteroidaceae bacterium]
MKRFLSLFVSALFCIFAVTVSAQVGTGGMAGKIAKCRSKAVQLRKELSKQKAPITKKLMQVRADEREEVLLLDSVISNRVRYYYEYNQYGYLVSAKEYNYNSDAWELDCDVNSSFSVEFEFNSDGRCVRRSDYACNADGSKGEEFYRVEASYNDGYREKVYGKDSEMESEGLLLKSELAFDKWNNLVLYKKYDVCTGEDDLEEWNLRWMVEQHFSGKVYPDSFELDLDEITDPEDLVYDEELDDLYCDYRLVFRYNDLRAWKRDVQKSATGEVWAEYEIDESYDYAFELPSSYDDLWQPSVKTVIEYNDAKNRFASVDKISYYMSESDVSSDYVSSDYVSSVIVSDTLSRTFTYDSLYRLTSYQSKSEGEYERNEYTYYDDFANEISLDEFKNAFIEYYITGKGFSEKTHCCQGEFYGHVAKNTSYSRYGFEEIEYDSYNSEGNPLHATYKEVEYSDAECGEDLNGDGVISTERSVVSGEITYTYRPDGALDYYVDANADDAEYLKMANIYDEYGRHCGFAEYNGASAEGPWSLYFEEADVFDADGNKVGYYYRYCDGSGYWGGYKYVYDSNYSVDNSTGEWVSYASYATRSATEYEEGYNDISYTEDGWSYSGYVDVSNGVIVGGELTKYELSDVSVSDVNLNSFEFPYSPFEMDRSWERSPSYEVYNERYIWDTDLNDWRMYGAGGLKTYKSAENEITYDLFGYEAGEPVLESRIIYTTDAQGRVIAEKDENFDCNYSYTYLNDENDYLSEYVVTKPSTGVILEHRIYYYSTGLYIPPMTDIDEPTAAVARIENGMIMASGIIRVYDMQGRLVVDGAEAVSVPSPGIYIVDVAGVRCKISVK